MLLPPSDDVMNNAASSQLGEMIRTPPADDFAGWEAFAPGSVLSTDSSDATSISHPPTCLSPGSNSTPVNPYIPTLSPDMDFSWHTIDHYSNDNLIFESWSDEQLATELFLFTKSAKTENTNPPGSGSNIGEISGVDQRIDVCFGMVRHGRLLPCDLFPHESA